MSDDDFHSDGEGCGQDEDCGCGDFQSEQHPFDEIERRSGQSGCLLLLLALPASSLLLLLR